MTKLKRQQLSELYEHRKLSQGYPDLDTLANEYFAQHPLIDSAIEENIACLERIVALPQGLRTVAIVGCGPRPNSVKQLLARGYDVTGVEPFPGFVQSAIEFVGDAERIKQGSAEKLPFPDGSQAVVMLESVLEHVDSPNKSLAEAYRVLAPGGVAYVQTTNRFRFNPTGFNWEYRIPFFNYFPRTFKEAVVHHQLHFQPELANYTTRPAVHWFSYADLCALGREIGFHRFYSKLDALRPDDPAVASSRLRRAMIRRIQRNAFWRALALIQFGDEIFMLKREE